MELIAPKKPVLKILFQSCWLNTPVDNGPAGVFLLCPLPTSKSYLQTPNSGDGEWQNHIICGSGIRWGEGICGLIQETLFTHISVGFFLKQYYEICALPQGGPSFPWIQCLCDEELVLTCLATLTEWQKLQSHSCLSLHMSSCVLEVFQLCQKKVQEIMPSFHVVALAFLQLEHCTWLGYGVIPQYTV